MSEPAIRALKETFNCRITVLTSTAGAAIAKHLPVIDEFIVFDAAWVKTEQNVNSESFLQTADLLKDRHFDAAVLFTVYSQNPLPSAMLMWLANIPKRLAYCRENPYNLLTHWVPEQEPYNFVRHQVRRDLDLVKTIGASVKSDSLQLWVSDKDENVMKKLRGVGIDLTRPWLVLHPGVSEDKRKYPEEKWIETGQRIISDLGYQIVMTGSASEKTLTHRINSKIKGTAVSCAGMFTMEEFIVLIKLTPLLISVNTSAAHIASATGTKVIVLYALTNPQHSPWKTQGKILPFTVPQAMQSKNEILRFTAHKFFKKSFEYPEPEEIIVTARTLLSGEEQFVIPELVTSETLENQLRVTHGISSTLNFNEP